MNDLDKHVYVKSKSLLPSLPLSSSSSSLLPLSSSLTSLLVPSKVRLNPIKRSNSIVKKNVEDLFKQTENNYQNILLSSISLTTIKTTKSSSITNNHDYDCNDNRSKSSTAALMNSSLYISNNKLKQSYTNQISNNNKNNISNNNDNNVNNICSGSSNQHSSIRNSKCILSNNVMYDDNHHTTNQSRVLTQRESLSQVTSRAWNNTEPLSYIPRLDELLPMHLSWNSKVTKNNEVSNYHNCLSNYTQTTTIKVPKNYDKKRPTINIIG